MSSESTEQQTWPLPISNRAEMGNNPCESALFSADARCMKSSLHVPSCRSKSRVRKFIPFCFVCFFLVMQGLRARGVVAYDVATKPKRESSSSPISFRDRNLSKRNVSPKQKICTFTLPSPRKSHARSNCARYMMWLTSARSLASGVTHSPPKTTSYKRFQKCPNKCVLFNPSIKREPCSHHLSHFHRTPRTPPPS